MTLTSADALLTGSDLARRYGEALATYCLRRDEAALVQAYELSREALSTQLSLADYAAMFSSALSRLMGSATPAGGLLVSAEAFFLEGITVYDMALRGYQGTVANLRAEVAERRRIEEELRDITFALARQRDDLDSKVQLRTRELREHARELESINARLIHANREQADFTYSLSHDLKTPINTIDMFLQAILEDFQTGLDAQAVEMINIASQTADRMRTLIDDVLEYSRVVEQQFQVEPVELGPLLREITDDMRAAIQDAGGEVRLAALPRVKGNPFQLRVLFSNLLSNALKYRARGRAPQVEVLAAPGEEADRVTITVRDNGIGIAADRQAQIFELFRRLHTFDEYQGSGIGLALCKRVANSHGTNIRVISTEGTGSSFSIDLTLCEEAA